MKAAIGQHGEIIVRQQRALRRITLNRPKALNALTLDMCVAMTGLLQSWATDPGVVAILLDGAGERGLCAGGDIRALYDAAKARTRFAEQFWTTEYRLDVLITRYPKPVIAIMDGVVMGGGVGIAAHASHRVVTERSSVAMPEVGIGFFPDVGASFLLARSPGHVGTHLVLTGAAIGAADAIYCGLAGVHVPAARLDALASALADCRTATDVDAALKAMAVAPSDGRLAAARSWIDACYATDEVEVIVDRLHARNTDDTRAALAAIGKKSPTSLKVALRNIRSALSFQRVEESFRQDYRIALACVAGHDFVEGIRATIVDKDRNPAWRPDRIEDVTADLVDRHFRLVGAPELTFAA